MARPQDMCSWYLQGLKNGRPSDVTVEGWKPLDLGAGPAAYKKVKRGINGQRESVQRPPISACFLSFPIEWQFAFHLAFTSI